MTKTVVSMTTYGRMLMEFKLGALKLINTFSGDKSSEDIEEWLESIEHVGRLGGWNDAQKIAVARGRVRGSDFPIV